MTTIKFFEITYNNDRTEGRGRTISTDICFANAEDAFTYTQSTEYASKYGVQSTKGSKHDIKETSKTVYNDIEDYEVANKVKLVTPETIRQRKLFAKFESMTKEELVMTLVQQEIQK